VPADRSFLTINCCVEHRRFPDGSPEADSR
jgi:hypothetical protein